MVGEVVSDQSVEQVCVVGQVSRGDGDQLSVPGRGGMCRSPGEEAGRFSGLLGHQRRCDQERRRLACAGELEDLTGGCGVTADQPEEQDLDV
jgi:hypothetical protein